jgi:hypothetical protein
VVEVRFTKAQFTVLSRAERELLIRVGLVQNDLLFAMRLWAAYTVRFPRGTLKKQIYVVHAVATLLMLVGKLFEAFNVFDKIFLKQTFHAAYLNQFSNEQKSAAADLKKRLGANSLLYKLRNRYAFHFHLDESLSVFADDWDQNTMMKLYLGDPDVNSLSSYAASMFLNSLMKLTGSRTPDNALRYIQRETAKALKPMITFIAAVHIAAVRRMCGNQVRFKDMKIPTREFKSAKETEVPYLMRWIPIPRQRGRFKRRNVSS